MTEQIAISYPETLAFSLNMRKQEFEREMKTISLVKFYELGKVSSGMAANALVKYKLERAKETMEDVRIAVENERWFTASNKRFAKMAGVTA
jgi:replicative superfamily II helicase